MCFFKRKNEENEMSVLEDRELISLSVRGQLLCFKNNIAFMIYVNPASKAGNGKGAVISVYVV